MLKPTRVRQLYAWHKWTGLVTGIFIFILSLTGAMAVFKHDIDALLTPGIKVPVTGERLPLETIYKSIKEQLPGKRLIYLDVAQWPGDTHQFNLKIDGTKYDFFVNPYNGQISGRRTGETFANVLRQTHLRLFYFKWQGRVFVGVMGLALLISSITGLIIYFPFMKKLSFGQIRWNRKLQLILSDWHKLIGITTIIFNIVIGLTGAVLGLENLQRYSDTAKIILHPKPSKADRQDKPKTLDDRLTIDEAVLKAQEAIPQFVPEYVRLPRAKKNHWYLKGHVDRYLAAKGTAWIILDTHTGATIAKEDPRQTQLLTKAYNVSEPLHFGYFAGPVVKVLYTLLGLASGLLSISGFIIWILKWRKYRRQS